jgi:hypothetical protein
MVVRKLGHSQWEKKKHSSDLAGNHIPRCDETDESSFAEFTADLRVQKQCLESIIPSLHNATQRRRLHSIGRRDLMSEKYPGETREYFAVNHVIQQALTLWQLLIIEPKGRQNLDSEVSEASLN